MACAVVLGLAACGSDDGDDAASEPAAREAAGNAVLADLNQARTANLAATAQYVGKVDGTNAYIGLITTNDELRIYVCDGAQTVGWVDTTLNADSFDGSNPAGLGVSGTIHGDAVQGTVKLADGSSHPFAAKKERLPAGVYELELGQDGAPAVSGTIVLPDGTQRGAIRKRPLSETCARIKASYQDYMVSYMPHRLAKHVGTSCIV